MNKKLLLFLIYLTFFSIWIYIFKNYFFWTLNPDINSHIENVYIEPIANDSQIIENINSWKYNNLDKITDTNKEIEEIKDIIYENENLDTNKIEVNNIENNVAKEYEPFISIKYNPSSFKDYVINYSNTFLWFLKSGLSRDKIDYLTIELNEKKWKYRWKMKNHNIYFYWVLNMWLSEFNAVWIHEFAHFIDLYYLKKSLIKDISDYFYNISWIWVDVIKAWQESKDFVSGYSMTNKYEDFAESFTYFILHNKHFLEKTKKSEILKKKYEFFERYLFKNNELSWTNFASNSNIEPYYRDITKIKYSLNDFLKFLIIEN